MSKYFLQLIVKLFYRLSTFSLTLSGNDRDLDHFFLEQNCLIWVGKKHVFGKYGTVAGMDWQTLACALDVMVLRRNLTYNGPAIWGGCVT